MLRSKDRRERFFATSLPDLDEVLHGGLPTGTITEVCITRQPIITALGSEKIRLVTKKRINEGIFW